MKKPPKIPNWVRNVVFWQIFNRKKQKDTKYLAATTKYVCPTLWYLRTLAVSDTQEVGDDNELKTTLAKLT